MSGSIFEYGIKWEETASGGRAILAEPSPDVETVAVYPAARITLRRGDKMTFNDLDDYEWDRDGSLDIAWDKAGRRLSPDELDRFNDDNADAILERYCDHIEYLNEVAAESFG